MNQTKNMLRNEGESMKLSVVKKIVLGIVGVSIVTYGCSAFFIFYLKDIIAPGMSDWLYLSIILSLGIFWTGLLGWIGASRFIKPLLRLASAANEAATGNLQVEIPDYGSDDEIRLLSNSFRTMIYSLRQIITDLSGNVSFTHHHAGMLSGGMAQAADQVERIAGATATISNGALKQAESMQGMLTAVARIKHAAGDIGEKASESRTISKEMLKTIEESGIIIRSLVDGMMILAQSSRESIGFVEQLNDNAKDVRNISRVVGDIADQTHLLALNASIEAARAGEYGQGFAVVAMEIRKLAEQSTSAVNHIDQLITHMESVVTDVVVKITEQEQFASREINNGEAAKASLDRINIAVRKDTEAVENIALSISDQIQQVESAMVKTDEVAMIANQISVETREVSSSVQEQMAVMEELTSSSEMLKSQANLLSSKINVFRL
jgi:methyl-accepting chemotaxis protein